MRLDDATAINVGEAAAAAVYLGGQQVWSSDPDPGGPLLQVRRLAAAQTLTTTGSTWSYGTGTTCAVVAEPGDSQWAESDPTANSVTGVRTLETPFTIPGAATVLSAIARLICRLTTPGSRSIRAGISGTQLPALQNLTSTDWTTLDFDLTPYTATPAELNAITGGYFRAYASTPALPVQVDLFEMRVEYQP
ncbi:MAG: hypothetical protein QM628_00200 [Propionicimonas sp.]